MPIYDRIARSADDLIKRLDDAKPIRAYHGSPYDFDRFDASKIDTGEGAQAYGHGLYFAGNEDVAKTYRDSLSGQLLVDGKPIQSGQSGWVRDWASRIASVRDVSREVRSLQRSIRGAETDYAGLRRIADDLGPEAAYEKVGLVSSMAHAKSRLENLQDRMRAYESLAGRDVRYHQGNMYEVQIAHPEESLLDWDAPMSAQPKAVQRAFGDMAMDRAGDGRRVYKDIVTRRGEEFDDDATGLLAGRAAADELMSEGVPGIRYLDGFSRRDGQGTRNYVMFPGAEDSITILRKYGMLPPLAGAAAMQGDDQP